MGILPPDAVVPDPAGVPINVGLFTGAGTDGDGYVPYPPKSGVVPLVGTDGVVVTPAPLKETPPVVRFAGPPVGALVVVEVVLGGGVVVVEVVLGGGVVVVEVVLGGG
jgi:hypothetical protein